MKELLADIKRNTAAVGSLPDPATRKYLQETLWPFLQGLVENLQETLAAQSDAINAAIDESDEILFESSAGAIMEPLVLAGELLIVFKTQLEGMIARGMGTKETKKLLRKIEKFGVLTKEAMEIITEISIPDPEEDPEEKSDDDGDDETPAVADAEGEGEGEGEEGDDGDDEEEDDDAPESDDDEDDDTDDDDDDDDDDDGEDDDDDE